MSAADRDKTLNEWILNGKAMEAFEEFYADDVQMQENSEVPRKGKPLNREYEQKFFQNLETFHGVKLLSSAIRDDVTFSEWEFDLTMKGAPRTKMSQVSVRHWKNNKVVNERFYHNP